MAKQINDEVRRYLIAQGYTSPLWVEALRAATGSSSLSPNSLWLEFLDGEGYTSGTLNDRMRAWLEGKGYSGSLNSMLVEALVADDIFAGGATLLVYDTFVTAGAGDEIITAHTPDIDNLGTGWSDSSGGSFQVNWGPYYLGLGSTNAGAYFDVTSGNLPIIMETGFNSTNSSAFTARFIDSNNQWLLFIPQGGKVLLYDRVSGTNTLRAESVGSFSGSTVWLSDDGSTITFGFDRGAAEGSFTSTTHDTSTNYGYRGQTGGRADNFILMGGTTSTGDLYTP